MEKSPESSYPSEVEKITQERIRLGMPEYRPNVVRAASLDPVVREKAERDLDEEVEIERTLEQSRPVDIMELLAPFSEEEVRLMLSETLAVQLSEGCNGHCPFCFLSTKEEKRGVVAHFTFRSLKVFFEKYSSKMRSDLPLYWKSDPFDWNDEDEEGKYTFIDFYKVKPRSLGLISTAIPKGGEQRFIDFTEFLFQEQLSYLKDLEYQGDYYYGPRIRISVGKHNISRVEYTLKNLIGKLRDLSCTDEDIEMFFRHCVMIETRFEPQAIGPLISKHDDIRVF